MVKELSESGQLRSFEYFPNTGPSLMPSLNMNIRAYLSCAVLLMLSMNANAGLFGFGGTSWKEEALLHDGSTIVVERSVERGGRHEIGQQPTFKEQSLSFRLPSTHQNITWEDHFSEDLGSASFLPMLLDIVNGTPYVVANPMGCLSYNKWGRPNPPYVIFKHDGNEWKRIPLEELPAEIKVPNVIISDPDNEMKKIGKNFVTAAEVKEANRGFRQSESRIILREPVKNEEGSTTNCPDYNSERYRSPKAPLPMKPRNE